MTTEPVGLAQDLPAQRVMRALVGEQDLAIWRGASLSVQAWANRCPHRGMRLSYGFVRGDSLACAYHGWHYNCAAQCHYIPAHPDLEPPQTIQATAFSVVEQNGVLWVSTSAAAAPVNLPAGCSGVRSITFNCEMSDALAAFKAVALSDEQQIQLSVSEFAGEPNVLTYSNAGATADSTDSILVLMQQSGIESVTAHILANSQWSSQGRVKVSRWSESVRRYAERPVSEAAST